MTPIILNTTQGSATIQDDRLIGADVLLVLLSGLQYDIVSSNPADRQVMVDSVAGELNWSGLLPFLPNAKAFVLIN